ncbi:MAG: DUF4058 family protein [Chloroflexi bacterium]|nr:DUF4058 family protein [Chloroflexota bacterium]
MKSPFPGMDPYLEKPSLWHDVHHALTVAIRDTLAPQLAPRYYVALEERTYIAATDPDTFVGRPDAAVLGEPREPGEPTLASAPVAVLERAITVDVPIPDEIHHGYLEIRETATHRVITAIEILSPANKLAGKGREEYEEKRLEIFGARTNRVEIDLLRAGKPMPMGHLPASHYRILVRRGWERGKAQLFPFNITDPISSIHIPLQKGETEPTLALGELLARVYASARYDLRIDYRRDPEPLLDPAVAAWCRDLVRQAAQR